MIVSVFLYKGESSCLKWHLPSPSLISDYFFTFSIISQLCLLSPFFLYTFYNTLTLSNLLTHFLFLSQLLTHFLMLWNLWAYLHKFDHTFSTLSIFYYPLAIEHTFFNFGTLYQLLAHYLHYWHIFRPFAAVFEPISNLICFSFLSDKLLPFVFLFKLEWISSTRRSFTFPQQNEFEMTIHIQSFLS